MPCTGDWGLKFKVSFVSNKEPQCMNVNILWRCKGCVHNNGDHFWHWVGFGEFRLWDVMPCSLLKVKRFRGTFCFCLQCWRVGQARNQHDIGCKQDYIALRPKDRTLHNHCCENLKSCMGVFCLWFVSLMGFFIALQLWTHVERIDVRRFSLIHQTGQTICSKLSNNLTIVYTQVSKYYNIVSIHHILYYIFIHVF
jgi:hypothetical protein